MKEQHANDMRRQQIYYGHIWIRISVGEHRADDMRQQL
jgi:hypothetical protein